MSWNPALDPDCPTGDAVDAIETVIVPRARDLGGFEVRRALPAARRQMVGPFIFFDQMGPAEFLSDEGIDVRPHPHVNLATLTYLFDGEILHAKLAEIDEHITRIVQSVDEFKQCKQAAEAIKKKRKYRMMYLSKNVNIVERNKAGIPRVLSA